MICHTESTIPDLLFVGQKSQYYGQFLESLFFVLIKNPFTPNNSKEIFSSVSFNLVINYFILDKENQTISQIDCASGELPEEKTLSNSEISTERYFVLLF